MTDDVHAALQLPLVLVTAMAGAIMLYRSRKTIKGEAVDRSPALQMCMGLMLIALAAKQLFWQAVWAAKASGLFLAAQGMVGWIWIATALNFTAIVLGAIVCVFAARPIFGPSSAPVVLAFILATTAASAWMVSQ